MRASISQSVGRGGRNRAGDVDTLLHLINLHRRRTGKAPLKQRKMVDDEFIAAIEEYQRNSLRQRPTGLIESASADMACLRLPLGTYAAREYSEPPWLKVACEEKRKSIRELPGLDANNPEILKYIATFPGLTKIDYRSKGVSTSHRMSGVDETPWCACFVNWCLLQAKKKQGVNATAKSWLTYGQQTTPKVGAICVLYRTPFSDSNSGWHVGFYLDGPPDAPVLLGGNQGNAVSVSQFFDLESTDFRWPLA